MLRSVRLLLASLSLLVAVPAVQAQGSPSGDRDDCVRGRVHGAWNLPGPTSLGRAGGVLITSDGATAFVLRARLLPRPTPGPLRAGDLRGQLVLPPERDGAEPEPVGRLVGGWVAAPDGSGRFEALVVRPGEAEDDPPVRIGRLRGRFLDGAGPDDPGRFHGVFVLCP